MTMPLFSNPAGFWALLGVPAIVAVHFLQQRSRTFVTASADARVFTLVQGTEPSLADIHGWNWLEGQGFTDADLAASAAKVVLGRIASARLFGEGVDPTGRKVTIHDREFEVVGMMRAVDAEPRRRISSSMIGTIVSGNFAGLDVSRDIARLGSRMCASPPTRASRS
jgi:hypothetical protein